MATAMIKSMFQEDMDMGRRRGQRSGYLRKKGPSWLLEWREDILVEGALRRAKFSQTIAPALGPGKISKREAERIAFDTILSKLDAVSQRPQSLLTVREFVRKYFEPDVVYEMRSTGGRPHYEYLLEKHVLPAIGDLRLRDTTADHVQALMRQKLKTYSTQTVTHIRNCISAIFRHAKGRRAFTGDLPTEGVRLPEMVRVNRRALTWEAAKAIIEGMKSPYGDLAFMLAATGMRIGEACGLRWKRVNFSETDIIFLDGIALPPLSLMVSEVYTKGRWGSPKTGNSYRILPLAGEVASRLARLKARAHLISPDDPVFVTTHGNPVDRCTSAEKFLKPVARKLGMPWVSWHSLRHTAATFADQVGLTVSERQRILGHGTERMTLRYTHAELDHVRQRMNEIANRLAEPMKEGTKQ